MGVISKSGLLPNYIARGELIRGSLTVEKDSHGHYLILVYFAKARSLFTSGKLKRDEWLASLDSALQDKTIQIVHSPHKDDIRRWANHSLIEPERTIARKALIKATNLITGRASYSILLKKYTELRNR